MDRKETWAVAGTVAVGVASIGVAVDRRLGTGPFATTAGAATAGLYLAGTFFPKARIFGKPADVVTSDNVLALTFDDGPDPRYTREISRVLAERGHQATFFVLARATLSTSLIAAVVANDGHDLACHGDDHGLLAFATPREVRRQIATTETAVREATGIAAHATVPRPARRSKPMAEPGREGLWLPRVRVGWGSVRHCRARLTSDR